MKRNIKADKRWAMPIQLAIFTALIVFAAAGNASAQWTTNGNDINNTNTGNVGIGTTSPAGKLDLNGPDAAPTSGAPTNGTFLLGALPSTNLVLAAGVSTSGSIFSWLQSRNRGSANFYNLALNPVGGSVGIGTTSPIYSLDVNGGVNAFRSKTSTASANDTIATFENSSGIQAIVRANGNIGIGTITPSTKLHVVGDVTVTGNIAAKYQDVAEWVPTSQKLAPGTVVVLDAKRGSDVIASSQAYDTKVAGVISVKPGLALGESGENKVLVATSGRVRVKVDATRAPIQVGDLLVTSDTTGLAMKSEPILINGRSIHSPGTLIGKALESLDKGTGEIMVLLSLQ